MSAFEGSAKSQLQGVSQQVPRERLDGQVTAQENMLSDVVTGLRRRPGAEAKFHTTLAAGTAASQFVGFSTDIGGQKVNVTINTKSGTLTVFDEDWNIQQSLANSYLISSDRINIRATTVGDEFIVCNVGAKPAVSGAQAGLQDPNFTGWFYVKTGAFDRDYQIDLGYNGESVSNSVHYRTPVNDGEDPTAADRSTPEYIAAQLGNQIANVLDPGHTTFPYVGVYGAYVFVKCAGNRFRVSTPLPSTYIGTSGGSYVQTAGELPAKLDPGANGIVMAVGDVNRPTYFKYDSLRLAWVECGLYGSPGALINMPLRLSYNGTTWVFKQDYEGRYAGDDITAPLPNFITRGITGMGAFQGRLVLLSGSLVCMSASGLPQRWFRSTVTSVLASDCIEVGASANSSAAYQYCVPFQKDLLLFAGKYQALVPGGNTPVTPQTASVIVTSTYEADVSCSPIPTGRTLMFPQPRSQDFYGVMEMVPSQYTDSQYLSSDVTSHLPKYLPGRCRFAVSSSVANMALFASDRDLRTLVVHEYLWDADNKVQQSWHKWTFPFDIADAFFSGSDIFLLFVQNGFVTVGAIDPRIGTLTAQADRRPYLDLYMDATVAGNSVAIPIAIKDLDATAYQRVKLSDKDAMLLGEEVGIDARSAATVTTVPSFPAGAVTIGMPYRSSFSPTPPLVKDSNGVVISSNKLSILRYMIGTTNSAEYSAIVADASTDAGDDTQVMPALYWGSSELELGAPRVNGDSVATLPCRTNAATTTLLLYTEGLGEMNILSLEYVARYNQKLKRR